MTRFTYTRRATPAEAAAIRAKRAKRNAPPALSEDAKALIVNTITEQVDALPTAADGSPGDDGADGWSPLFALSEDGERRVLELTGWTGGTGDKPEVYGFVGEFGIVPNIADAVDIRGVPGPRGLRGAPGKDGSTIYVDTRNPKSDEGGDSDVWVNTSSGGLYQRLKGVWKLKGDLRGPRGFAGSSGRDGLLVSSPCGDGSQGSSIIMDSGPPPDGGVVGQDFLVGSGVPS